MSGHAEMLEDVGEARVLVPENRRHRASRLRTAQLCLEVAAMLMAVAHELDPDLPDDHPSTVQSWGSPHA